MSSEGVLKERVVISCGGEKCWCKSTRVYTQDMVLEAEHCWCKSTRIYTQDRVVEAEQCWCKSTRVYTQDMFAEVEQCWCKSIPVCVYKYTKKFFSRKYLVRAFLTSASTPGPKNATYFSMRSGSTHLLNGVILDWNTIVNPSSPFGSTDYLLHARRKSIIYRMYKEGKEGKSNQETLR